MAQAQSPASRLPSCGYKAHCPGGALALVARQLRGDGQVASAGAAGATAPDGSSSRSMCCSHRCDGECRDVGAALASRIIGASAVCSDECGSGIVVIPPRGSGGERALPCATDALMTKS
mmetsp:Transcript_12436/g.32519  ORF Transcript_12436/g.32519 Transcript_12436/m.32519 type:complete len:119 (+) Transcript_12436:736-1092(+)